MTIRDPGHGTPGGARLAGTLQGQVYLGATRKCLVALAGGHVATVRLSRETAARLTLADGQPVEVAWDLADGIVLRR